MQFALHIVEIANLNRNAVTWISTSYVNYKKKKNFTRIFPTLITFRYFSATVDGRDFICCRRYIFFVTIQYCVT